MSILNRTQKHGRKDRQRRDYFLGLFLPFHHWNYIRLMAHAKGISRGEVVLQIVTKYRSKPYNETDKELLDLIIKRAQTEWNHRKERIFDATILTETWKAFKQELNIELEKEKFTENEIRQITHNIQK